MDGHEKPDLGLAWFTLLALVVAGLAATVATAPLYALLGLWTGLPDLVRLLCALVVWYAGFRLSQAVIGRLFERSAIVRRATTPREWRAEDQS